MKNRGTKLAGKCAEFLGELKEIDFDKLKKHSSLYSDFQAI